MDPRFIYGKTKNDEQWTLMCPHKCPGLSDCYGDDFNALYLAYELDGRGKRIKC